MKWVLVDKFDNIAHTVDLNAEYTDKEAQRYFVNLKQIPYENSYPIQLKLPMRAWF